MVDKCGQKDSMVDQKPCSFPMKYGYFRGKPVTPGYLPPNMRGMGTRLLSSHHPIPLFPSMVQWDPNSIGSILHHGFLGGSERSSSELFGVAYHFHRPVDLSNEETKVPKNCISCIICIILYASSTVGARFLNISQAARLGRLRQNVGSNLVTQPGRVDTKKTRAVGQISISGILKPIMLKHQEVF